MKKLITISLMALLAMAIVFAQGASEAKPEGKTITYVTLGDNASVNALLPIATQAFYEKTGITVKTQVWAHSDGYQKITTYVGSENQPDAMYGYASWVQEFANKGWIVPIDDKVSSELIADFSDASKQALSVNGRLYAMPSYVSIRSLLINKDRFAEAGVEVPTTWEELLEVAPKLYDPSSAKYAYTLVAGHAKNTLDCFLPVLWAYGADLINADSTANGFNNEQGIKALKVYCELAKYSVPDYGQADINSTQANFTSQVAAAYFHNGQGVQALLDAGQDTSFIQVVAPLKGDGGEAYSLGVMDIDIVLNGPNAAEAAQWLEFWHQVQYLGKAAEGIGFLTAQKSINAGIESFSDPANETIAPFVVYEPIAKFKSTIFCFSQIQQIVADAVTKAVFGQVTPEEAFASAGAQVDALLK